MREPIVCFPQIDAGRQVPSKNCESGIFASVALWQWNLLCRVWNGTCGTTARGSRLKPRRSSPELREGLMSAKKQLRSWDGNKTEEKSGLSRHYREIGIKAVAAATRKESATSPRPRDSMAINRKRNSTEGGH